MIEKLLKDKYKLNVQAIEKSSVGAGSDTYFVTCDNGKYVVKFPCESDINNPDIEPKICEYLLNKGIPVSEFIKNIDGEYISYNDENRKFHVQKFVDGKMYELNTAPKWLLEQSSLLLGKIHHDLKGFEGLHEGIGENFFKYMTPKSALNSYLKTIEIAKQNGEKDIEKDLEFRIDLMNRFPDYNIDVQKLTCINSHGDYFISQLICGDNKINAVIDWTTSCVHPIVWEIIRSYLYAAPSCINGEINIDEFAQYVKNYLVYGKLNDYDIDMIGKLFYYQIAVCDYYNQYYKSKAANRNIYLHQAIFSTKLMRWFDKNIDAFTDRIKESINC